MRKQSKEKCKGLEDDIRRAQIDDGVSWVLIEDVNGVEWVQECATDGCVMCKEIRNNDIKIWGKVEPITD